MPRFILNPGQAAVKVADLSGSKGCYGLNIELLTWTAGDHITFGFGANAQDLLNGPPGSLTNFSGSFTAGKYGNGFSLPDGDGEVHRMYPFCADQLWARAFGVAPIQFDVEPFATGGD